MEQARGRRYPELAHPYRNEFQRDRDRVVHSRAFRRLERKTQVFAPDYSDHFRNRLTHTLEVSQIARTVAAILGLDEDFTEALALAHDIGHPPFAHSGEAELNRQMQRFGESFDHNLHALRIVEHFEQRYARFPGLNLTFEVREGIVKHSRDYDSGIEFLPGLRPPLEAQLIDLADEIAYNTADLDDAFSARMFRLSDIASAVPYYGEVLDEVEMQFPGAPDQVKFNEALRRVIDFLVSGFIQGTFVAAAESGAQDTEDVRRLPARLASFTVEADAARGSLKQFLHQHVYHAASLVEERQRSIGMIAGLFDYYLADPGRLPAPYDELARHDPPHRVVCDYIAGMTDGFCRRAFESLQL